MNHASCMSDHHNSLDLSSDMVDWVSFFFFFFILLVSYILSQQYLHVIFVSLIEPHQLPVSDHCIIIDLLSDRSFTCWASEFFFFILLVSYVLSHRVMPLCYLWPANWTTHLSIIGVIPIVFTLYFPDILYSQFTTASCMLSFSLTHQLLAALTFLYCHLHRVKLDMNARIEQMRCDFNTHFDILFFLMFSIKPIPWAWRPITCFHFIFRGQFYINVGNCFPEIVFQTNLNPAVYFV